MSNQMYINRDGRVLGPFTKKEIAEMGRNGTINPNTSVSLDKNRWFQASIIQGLIFAQSGSHETAPDETGTIPRVASNVEEQQPEQAIRATRKSNGKLRMFSYCFILILLIIIPVLTIYKFLPKQERQKSDLGIVSDVSTRDNLDITVNEQHSAQVSKKVMTSKKSEVTEVSTEGQESKSESGIPPRRVATKEEVAPDEADDSHPENKPAPADELITRLLKSDSNFYREFGFKDYKFMEDIDVLRTDLNQNQDFVNGKWLSGKTASLFFSEGKLQGVQVIHQARSIEGYLEAVKDQFGAIAQEMITEYEIPPGSFLKILPIMPFCGIDFAIHWFM